MMEHLPPAGAGRGAEQKLTLQPQPAVRPAHARLAVARLSGGEMDVAINFAVALPLSSSSSDPGDLTRIVDLAVQQRYFESGTKSVALLASLHGKVSELTASSVRVANGALVPLYSNSELTIYKTTSEDLFKELVADWISHGALSASSHQPESPSTKRQKPHVSLVSYAPVDAGSQAPASPASYERRIMSHDFPTSLAAARSLPSLPSSPSIGSPLISELQATSLFQDDDESVSSVSMHDVFAAISHVLFHRFRSFATSILP